MNILPQIFNFETKNLLINEIIEKIKKEVISTIELIFTNFSSYRYIDNILTIQQKGNNLIKELIVKFIEIADKTYMESKIRKKKYDINKQNVKRTIVTIYGEINFTRTLYVEKKSNNYYFFIDDILGLEQYQTYDPIVRGLAIRDAVNNNPNNASYHSSLDSLDILNTLDRNGIPNISRQSIYRWIRNLHINAINYEPIDTKSTLYVMADEKWIHKQDKSNPNKKKWIMSKCFIVFTGIKRKKKRCKLIGKHVFITTSSSPYKELMDEIIESKDKQIRKDKITEYKNYILKHWKGIIAMKYSNVKSSMEAHISHCIASKFGSRPKAYSDKYCQTYLKLQEASLNNINILDYYLKSCCSDDNFIYNEKEVNFSIFDKSTSNLPCIVSSDPISIIINKIAYSTTNF